MTLKQTSRQEARPANIGLVPIIIGMGRTLVNSIPKAFWMFLFGVCVPIAIGIELTFFKCSTIAKP